MDKKTISRLKSVKRRSFFSTLFKGTTALVLMNSFPFKWFHFNEKKENNIRVEMNSMAVKRNRRG